MAVFFGSVMINIFPSCCIFRPVCNKTSCCVSGWTSVIHVSALFARHPLPRPWLLQLPTSSSVVRLLHYDRARRKDAFHGLPSE